MPHLVVDISSHGFGHLAQVAPVVAALATARPHLGVTVRCALPEAVVRRRIPHIERLVRVDLDVGMVMASALEVRVAASHAAHLEFHRRWPERVAAAAADLARLAPDLVLADIPYLSIAAARAAGIPVVALCSLNWADVYGAYCSRLPGAEAVLAAMTAAYAEVDLFLQATPHMPMAWIPRRRSIAPVAAPPAAPPPDLRRRLGIAPATRLLLAALGGIDTRLDTGRWPAPAGACWLVPAGWGGAAPRMKPVDTASGAFPELVAAADLILTKPGYGTFVEAAAHGTPVLYAAREDWPETPWLGPWLGRQVATAVVTPQALADGAFEPELARLLAAKRCDPRHFTGAAEAAAAIAAMVEKK